MDIGSWVLKAKKAERDAHEILAKHETSPSRIVLLEDLVKLLSGTPVDVQDYFKESVTCLEQELFRAAIVMSWAGHFHVYSEVLFTNHETDIKSLRPKWKFSDVNELKENYPEAQIIDVAKEVKFTSKAKLRILQGQLSTRNQCAHPTLYKPSLNSAIGYVDEMIRQTIDYLKP